MDILDDTGVSKLSAKVFLTVNNSFKLSEVHLYVIGKNISLRSSLQWLRCINPHSISTGAIVPMSELFCAELGSN